MFSISQKGTVSAKVFRFQAARIRRGMLAHFFLITDLVGVSGLNIKLFGIRLRARELRDYID